MIKNLRSTTWIAVAVLSAAGAIIASVVHFNASASCVADYDGRPILIGRTPAPETQTYIANNPGLSPSDLLLDAGGVPDRVWTADSIRSCRLLVSWAGLGAVPLLAMSAAALISSGRHRFLAAPKAAARVDAVAATSVPVYDAFISYRHAEPDNSHATEILEALEARDLRVAIDGRDFSPNEHFLSEMERCIRQSRFVLCVITSRYLDSDHTSEEAIISKTLDLAERRKRLEPLIFEPVELPVWLHGLVGIDFTATAKVDPLERLQGLLAARHT
jgi:hypothetical protein